MANPTPTQRDLLLAEVRQAEINLLAVVFAGAETDASRAFFDKHALKRHRHVPQQQMPLPSRAPVFQLYWEE